jgi:hypothetical protein
MFLSVFEISTPNNVWKQLCSIWSFVLTSPNNVLRKHGFFSLDRNLLKLYHHLLIPSILIFLVTKTRWCLYS